MLTSKAAQVQATVVADNVTLLLGDVKAGIADRLTEIPADRLIEALREWQASNPLIRNVFAWSERNGLIYPSPTNGLTGEDKRFMERYDALFNRRTPWTINGAAEAPGTAAATVQSARNAGRYEVQRLVAPKRKADAPGRGAPRATHGWIPWFWETQLHLLGWEQTGPERPRYGVEIEMSSLQSRMMGAIPSEVPSGMAVALVNANGHVVHQRGADVSSNPTRPIASVDLSPDLPHWQVKVYAVGPAAARSGGLYRTLSFLLVGVFAAAIISGGSLLLWQARRHFVDASQKTSFVSNVSHELKTPLTSIRMYAELLGSDRVRDPAKQRQYLGIIATESQRLTRLVNNVLDFSRLEQGRRKFHLDVVNIKTAIRDSVEAMRSRLESAGISIEEPVAPPEEVTVAADRDALSQVLLNLLDNAIKYSASGKEITFDIRCLDGTCEVRVMDRGPGIPERHRNRLFEKFYRVDSSLTASQPGSGLGLSIARRLMEGMGGSLRFEPRDGGGSVFVLTLAVEVIS